ncbi:DgyrCDS14766 [Dimorphilus gyrociliatus]|uniref:DgyrCDS14766 n=1 Tax=Dimorphilus gyrociliatus TaxID=2664684 RepID=A0A7I8WEZ9_9ANNE|nr:DgyrCDS14766 [Dimorphilus gyrociliatus]
MFKSVQGSFLLILVHLYKYCAESDECIDNILKDNMKLLHNDLTQRIDNLISLVDNQRFSRHTLKQIECDGQITLNQNLNSDNTTDYLISSKDYPKNYPHNHNCMIIINVEEAFNGHIELTFDEFHLEFSKNCRYDYLAISDDKQKVILCGKGLIKNSTGNSADEVSFFKNGTMQPIINKTFKFKPNGALVIRFKTGNKFTYSGFVLKANFRNDKFNCYGNEAVSDKIDKIATTEMITTKDSTVEEFLTTNNSDRKTTNSNTTPPPVEIDTTTPMPQLTTKTTKLATLLVNNKAVFCGSRTIPKFNFDCHGKSYNIISNNPYLPNSNCLIHLMPPRGKKGEVEFKFLSFNLQRNTGNDYDALTFAQGFRHIQYSGKANTVGAGTDRISIFRGRKLKPPKLRTTYYIRESGDFNINYFEATDTGGRSFEMLVHTKCTS